MIYIEDLGNETVNIVFINKHGLIRELDKMTYKQYKQLLNRGSSLWENYPGWDDVKEAKWPWMYRKLLPEFKI